MPLNKYGIGIIGSKSNIAEELLKQMSAGKRFVDLFGGGAAMSQCAAFTKKYDEIYYNDINTQLVKFIEDCYNGEYDFTKNPPKWVSKEEFHEKKQDDIFINLVYSFGTKGGSYAFGKDKEAMYKLLHEAIEGNPNLELLPGIENYLHSNDWIKRISEVYKYMKEVEKPDLPIWENFNPANTRLTHYARARKTANIRKIKESNTPITFNNIDYKDYIYQDGDVVYCDIPYEGVTSYDNFGKINFKHQEFYEWVKSREYKVYFSSYPIDEKYGFEILWQKEKKCTLNDKTNEIIKIETLYSN